MKANALLTWLITATCTIAAHAQKPDSPQLAAPAPVQAYAALPASKGARLSPDGQYLASIEPIQGRNAIVVRHLDGQSKPVALATGVGEPQWVIWKSDRRLVASLRLVNESGLLKKLIDTRLVSFDRDGSKLVKLVASEQGDFSPQIQDKVISELPLDPDHVLLELPRIDRFSRTPISGGESNARYEHPEVQRVNIHTGKTTTVNAQHGTINHWLADANGEVKLGWAYQRDKSVQIVLRDSEQTAWRAIQSVPLNTGQTFAPLSLVDPAGKRLLVESNHENGFDAIYEFDTVSQTYVRKVSPGHADDAVGLVRNGQFLGYAHTQQRSPTYVDPSWAADLSTVQRALPEAQIWLTDRTTDGKRVLLQVTQGNEPSEFWLLTRSTGPAELTAITNTYPGVSPEQIAPTRRVQYKARDGLTIPAFVTLPVHVKGRQPGAPLPFVVLPHGGPSSHDTEGFNYLVQFLVSRGYGVLQPQFRGSTGYGQAFLTAGYRQWGLAMQDDVTDGTRWLIEKKLADPQRIALVGGRYGGYAALMGLVKEPDLYRCAAAFAPVTDLVTLIDDRYGYIFGDLNVPRIGTDSSQLDATSPAQQAQRITKPVLLVHGLKDYTVHPRHTELLEVALKKAGKPSQVIYLPEADHFLSRAEDRLTYLQALSAFLSTNLGEKTSL